MAGARLRVLYPYPQNVDVFERAYIEDPPPFYRMAELHFLSLDALKACASSEGAQKAASEKGISRAWSDRTPL